MWRIPRALAVVGPAIAGLVLAAGCAERPQASQLTDAITEAANRDPTVDLTPEQARCIADALLSSDLSDTTLEGLAEDFDSPEVLAEEIDEVEPIVASVTIECVTGG